MSEGEQKTPEGKAALPAIPADLETRPSAFIEILSWAYVQRAKSILAGGDTLPRFLSDALFLLRDEYNEALEREEEEGTSADPVDGNAELFDQFLAILTPPKKETVGRSAKGNRRPRTGESMLGGETFYYQ